MAKAPKERSFGSRPHLSSASGIFARRGDPWVTEREGIEAYGRSPERENAERDWQYLQTGDTKHTRARMAEPKVELKTPRRTQSVRPGLSDGLRNGLKSAWDLIRAEERAADILKEIKAKEELQAYQASLIKAKKKD